MMRRMAPIVVVALAGGCAARDQVTCARDDECPPRASCAEGVCVATSDRDTVGIAPGAVEDPGEGEGEPTPPSSGGTGGVFDNGYAARLPLTLDGAFVAGSEPLVDFPVWIDVRAPELRARDAGGLLERRGGAVDVEVTTTAGESVAVEVVDLDDVGGRLRAWLRVPWLTPGEDVALWLYLGRALPPSISTTPVWDASYTVVLHLDDAPSADEPIADVTGTSVAVPRHLGAGDAIDGLVGGAIALGDDDDVVEIWGAHEDEGALTLEAWARMDDEHEVNGFQRIFHLGFAGERDLELFVEDSSTDGFGIATFRVDYDDTALSPMAALDDFALHEWHHYAGVFDADAYVQRLYVDGVLVVEAPFFGEAPDDDDVLHLGNWDARVTDEGSRVWKGALDEARVSRVARSAGWIATGVANMRAPGAFTRVGAVEHARGL